MAKKDQYLVTSNRDSANPDYAEAVRETTCVCGTFAKAYRVGLTLGEINRPDITYRKALELTKVQRWCMVQQKEGSEKISIVLIKSH